MTRSQRLVGSFVALGLALAGCLFPSFDDLGGGTGSAASKDASAGTTPTTTPTATAAPTTTTTAGGTKDAGPDAVVTPLPKVVPCRSNTCAVPSYCCANMLADIDDCRDADEDPDLLCAAQAAGQARAMRCDGPEDCGAGQVCCFVNDASQGASCATTCAATVMCHENAHCPVGKSCTGLLFSEYKTCQ